MGFSFAKGAAEAEVLSILVYTIAIPESTGHARRAMRTETTVNLSDAAVAQVMIPVDDFERGIAFYRDVLGIPFLFSAPPMMAFFKSGAARLLVGVNRTPKSELWLAEFTDPDGNPLALMSEVALAGA
jgi:predicted enzyme related to lactoylglutathione lyase